MEGEVGGGYAETVSGQVSQMVELSASISGSMPNLVLEHEAMNTQDSPAIARRAQAIYEQRLKTLLESSHWGEFVAIEPDSGDYFFGSSLSEAIRAARQAHPDRVGFAMRVGPQTTVQIG